MQNTEHCGRRRETNSDSSTMQEMLLLLVWSECAERGGVQEKRHGGLDNIGNRYLLLVTVVALAVLLLLLRLALKLSSLVCWLYINLLVIEKS